MALTIPTPDPFDAHGPGPTRDPRVAAFARDGYLGPLRIFTPAECRRIAAYLGREEQPAPPDWYKARAVYERALYDLATHPDLLSPIKAVLGDDVVLWGATAVSRGPGAVHPWHSDIESSSPDGRFLTVWIGLQHISRGSSLQMISRSHRLGKTVQEARLARGLRRELATNDELLAEVREHDPMAELVQPEMTNGDALLFDGRLWHGSNNSRHWGERLAILFQYAAADCAVRIPDLTQLEWPFRLLAAPRPPVILISGSDRRGVNRLVPAPPPSSKGLPMVATAVHHFDFPLETPSQAWQTFPAFRGPTRTFTDMSCHASILTAGHTPHPPHAHAQEELLISLRGEVELVIASSPKDPAPRLERLSPGSFVYYPSGQFHTIRNPGISPVSYLMFKWEAPRWQAVAPLSTGIFQYGDLTAPAGAPAFWTRKIFEGTTSCLGKLHAHLTVLQPGDGYEPHVDAYDVAIVVLSGTVETVGQRVEPLSVVYYAAGEIHGMRNIGPQPARYLVFEFHAGGVEVMRPPVPLYRSLPGRVLRMGKLMARPLWHRLKPYLAELRKRG